MMDFNSGRDSSSGIQPFLEQLLSTVQKCFWAVKTADKGLFEKGRNIRRIRVDSAHIFSKTITERVSSMKNIENGQSVLRFSRIRLSGFTLIEMVLVVVILAIAAMMAIPFATSGASTQLKGAATIIASDLEYAKSMAISRGKQYSVVFDTSTESYQIKDNNDVVISHPIKKGFTYTVNFAADSRLNRVDISNVNFDSASTISFDYLGSPYSGSGGGASPLNSGVITLSAGGSTMTVSVEPVTGYITITD
jgi:prepilin-type N-terminal cleavage/methylation domain-containing protein